MAISAQEAINLLNENVNEVYNDLDNLRYLIRDIDVAGTGLKTKTFIYSGAITENISSNLLTRSLAALDPEIRIINNTQARIFLDSYEVLDFLVDRLGSVAEAKIFYMRLFLQTVARVHGLRHL